MKIKYMNAAQAKVLSDSIQGFWDELEKYGHLQGGGIRQLEDAEIVIVAEYKTGTMLNSPPDKIKGFRILVEERDPIRL